MKKSLRFISMLLVAVMVLSFVACVVPEDQPPETTPAATSAPKTNPGSSTEEETTEPETTVNPHADAGLPSKNYNGENYVMLGRTDHSDTTYGATRDLVYLEDVTTNSINEAIRDRNSYVADLYNVQIKGNFVESKDYAMTLTSAWRGNLIAGDLICASIGQFANFIDTGSVKDIAHDMNRDYLDITQSYWNQDAIGAMSIAGNLYFLAGDIITTDKEGIWAVTFNRDIITNEGLEQPYQLVDDGNWTYAKMYAMAQTACDYEKHDPNDQFGIQWGLVSDASNNYYLWQGSGSRLIVKDPVNDLPSLGEITENAYNAMSDVATLQYDKTVTLFAGDIKGVGSDMYFGGTLKIFMEGKALFNCGSISIAEWLREHDTDFGLLPFPKYNQEQVGYYTGLSGSWSFAIGFQENLGKDNMGNLDPEIVDRVSIITQALACESTATLLEAYYDKTLVYKGLRREDDEKYLKMIFDGRLYDLSLIYDWASGISTSISNAKKASAVTSLKSKYDKYKSSCDKAIATFLSKHGLA